MTEETPKLYVQLSITADLTVASLEAAVRMATNKSTAYSLHAHPHDVRYAESVARMFMHERLAGPPSVIAVKDQRLARYEWFITDGVESYGSPGL